MDEILSNWKEIVLGILIPTITNLVIFFKWVLPYLKKAQQVQKLIDINNLMEFMTPVLEEIDSRMQILAKSSATIAESQKIIASEVGFTNSMLKEIQEGLCEVKRSITKE